MADATGTTPASTEAEVASLVEIWKKLFAGKEKAGEPKVVSSGVLAMADATDSAPPRLEEIIKSLQRAGVATKKEDDSKVVLSKLRELVLSDGEPKTILKKARELLEVKRHEGISSKELEELKKELIAVALQVVKLADKISGEPKQADAERVGESKAVAKAADRDEDDDDD